MLLQSIQNKGFTIELIGDDVIKITPFSELTAEQRDFIRNNKSQLISELKAANDALPLVEIDAAAAVDHAELVDWLRGDLGFDNKDIAEVLSDSALLDFEYDQFRRANGAAAAATSAAEVVTVTTSLTVPVTAALPVATDRYPSHSGGCYALPSEVHRARSQTSPAELAELVAKICAPRSQSA